MIRPDGCSPDKRKYLDTKNHLCRLQFDLYISKLSISLPYGKQCTFGRFLNQSWHVINISPENHLPVLGQWFRFDSKLEDQTVISGFDIGMPVDQGRRQGVYKRSSLYLCRHIPEFAESVSTASTTTILASRITPWWVIVELFLYTSEPLGSIYWLGMAQRGFTSFPSSVLSRLCQRSRKLWRTIRKVMPIPP